MTYSSRVWSHASFSEEIVSVDCLERRSPGRRIVTLPSRRSSINFLPNEHYIKTLFNMNANLSREKITFTIFLRTFSAIDDKRPSGGSYRLYRFGFQSADIT